MFQRCFPPPSSGWWINFYQTSWHKNPEDSHLQFITVFTRANHFTLSWRQMNPVHILTPCFSEVMDHKKDNQWNKHTQTCIYSHMGTCTNIHTHTHTQIDDDAQFMIHIHSSLLLVKGMFKIVHTVCIFKLSTFWHYILLFKHCSK
jgi:hypothetical protein